MALEPIYVKPRELPELPSVTATDVVMVDNGDIVGRSTPVGVVNAGAPVASEAEAIAGANNTNRMTPLRVRQVLDFETAPVVARAQAWAESDTPPDPLDPTSKSSKTWAEEAEASAVRAEAAADTIPLNVPNFSDLAGVTPAQLAVGDFVDVLSTGARYQRVSSGGDLNYTGTGGVRLQVLPLMGAFHVIHFGAIGSGGDDTSVFQAACNAAAARNVLVVEIQGGTYIVNGLSVPSGVWLRGEGYHAQTGSSLREGAIIARNADGPLMTVVGTTFLSGGPMNSLVRCSSIRFDGRGFDGDLVQMDAASLPEFNDCTFTGSLGSLLRMREVFDARFYNCRFGIGGTDDGSIAAVEMISGDGFEATNQIHFYSCVWESFRGVAIRTRRVGTTYNTNEIYFTNCKVESETSNTVLMDLQDTIGVHFGLLQVAARGTAGASNNAIINIENSRCITGVIHGEIFGSTRATWDRYIDAKGVARCDIQLSLYGQPISGSHAAVFDGASNLPSCTVRMLGKDMAPRASNIPDVLTRNGTGVIEGAPGSGGRAQIWFRDPDISGENWFLGNLTADGGGSQIMILHNSTQVFRVQNDNSVVAPTGFIAQSSMRLPVFTMATLPAFRPVGGQIVVSNTVDGVRNCYADGTNWRRVDNNAIVT